MQKAKHGTFLRRVYVKTIYLMQAVRKMNTLHIGDLVKREQGGIGITIQGVCSPYWDVVIDGTRYNGIYKSDLRLVHPVSGRISRIKKYYDFKMANWFMIDCYQKKLFSEVSQSF